LSNGIDWDDFRKTYNRIHKTNYKNTIEWISALYTSHNKFVSPLAKELGVGFGTINKYLTQWGLLERKPKGGNNYKDRPIGRKEQLFINIPEKTMKQLTIDQICERCSLCRDYAHCLIRKHDRVYRRFKRNEW